MDRKDYNKKQTIEHSYHAYVEQCHQNLTFFNILVKKF